MMVVLLTVLNEELDAAAAKRNRVNELMNEGLTKVVAERVAEIEQMKEIAIHSVAYADRGDLIYRCQPIL